MRTCRSRTPNFFGRGWTILCDGRTNGGRTNDECHARPRETARTYSTRAHTVRRVGVCYTVTCWCMLHGADERLTLSQIHGSLRRKCRSDLIHATYPPMSARRHASATLARFSKMSGDEGSWCMLHGSLVYVTRFPLVG